MRASQGRKNSQSNTSFLPLVLAAASPAATQSSRIRTLVAFNYW
jgi:hypothetical protein